MDYMGNRNSVLDPMRMQANPQAAMAIYGNTGNTSAPDYPDYNDTDFELNDIKQKRSILEREIASKPNAPNHQQALSMLKYYDNRMDSINQQKIRERQMRITEQAAGRQADEYQMKKRDINLQRQKEEGFAHNYNNVMVGSNGQKMSVPTFGQRPSGAYSKAMSGYMLSDPGSGAERQAAAGLSPERNYRGMPSMDRGDYKSKADVLKAQGDLYGMTPYNEAQANQMKGLNDVLAGFVGSFDVEEKKQKKEAAISELNKMPVNTYEEIMKVAYKAEELGQVDTAKAMYDLAGKRLEATSKENIAKDKPENKKNPVSRFTEEERRYIFQPVSEENYLGEIKQRPPTKDEINQRSMEISGEPFTNRNMANQGNSGGSNGGNQGNQNNDGLSSAMGGLFDFLRGGGKPAKETKGQDVNQAEGTKPSSDPYAEYDDATLQQFIDKYTQAGKVKQAQRLKEILKTRMKSNGYSNIGAFVN